MAFSESTAPGGKPSELMLRPSGWHSGTGWFVMLGGYSIEDHVGAPETGWP